VSARFQVESVRGSQPLADWPVRLAANPGPVLEELRTNEEGRISLSDLPAGPYAFEVERCEDVLFTVEPGEIVAVDRTFAQLIRVEGRVLLPDGVPIDDAEIVLSAESNPDRGVTVARSNRSGHFSFRTSVGFMRYVAAFAHGVGFSSRLELRLDEGDQIGLKLVIDQPGKLTEYRCRLDADWPLRVGAPRPRIDVLHRIVTRAITPDGVAMSLDPLPPPVRWLDERTFTFSAHALLLFDLVVDGHHLPRHVWKRSDLAPSPETNVLDFTPGVAVRGTVVDSKGTPVPRATVVVYHETSRARRSLRTSTTGAFSVDAIPAGEFTVAATSPHHGWSEPVVLVRGSASADTDPPLELVLPAARHVEVRVSPARHPVLGTMALYRASDGKTFPVPADGVTRVWMLLDSDEAFRLAPAVAQQHTLGTVAPPLGDSSAIELKIPEDHLQSAHVSGSIGGSPKGEDSTVLWLTCDCCNAMQRVTVSEAGHFEVEIPVDWTPSLRLTAPSGGTRATLDLGTLAAGERRVVVLEPTAVDAPPR